MLIKKLAVVTLILLAGLTCLLGLLSILGCGGDPDVVGSLNTPTAPDGGVLCDWQFRQGGSKQACLQGLKK